MFFDELQKIDARNSNLAKAPQHKYLGVRDWVRLHAYDSESEDLEQEAGRWSEELSFQVRNAR